MSERANLLYLHSDQHSPFVAGCYGDGLVHTPNLDRLAARGVVLDTCYCPSPLCVPSRMSALTGRHPFENGVWTNSHVLDSAIPTLAHAMGAGGCRPALIGRMHALGPDQLHGYAERLVGDHGPNHLGGRGVDHGELTGTAGPARVSLVKSGPGQSAYQVHDEEVTERAVDWLHRRGERRRAGEDDPFSLSVGFMLPHQPFVAKAEDYSRYEGRMTLPRTPEPFSDDLHPHLKAWRQACGIEEVPEEEVLRARTAYWGLVTRLDHMIGRILGALEAAGLVENTLVLYTSDHGEQAGEHGLWWKQTFYEDSVRVPAILAWPGRLPEGQRCGRVTSSLDLNATLLDALGVPAPAPLPGPQPAAPARGSRGRRSGRTWPSASSASTRPDRAVPWPSPWSSAWCAAGRGSSTTMTASPASSSTWRRTPARPATGPRTRPAPKCGGSWRAWCWMAGTRPGCGSRWRGGGRRAGSWRSGRGGCGRRMCAGGTCGRRWTIWIEGVGGARGGMVPKPGQDPAN